MPKISALVPIYKKEKYLCRCIDSIINQTYKDLEIILVDDGSPDRCPQICDEYAKKDKRIKAIHNQHSGVADARNTCLNFAKGEYVSFIDGDDYIHPQTFEIIIAVMEKCGAELSCYNFAYIKPEESPCFKQYEIENVKNSVLDSMYFLQNFDKYYHAVGWISPCTKVYKRELFDGLRYPHGKIDEDSYMLHRVAEKSRKIVIVEETLYYYVWTPNSISRSDFSPKNFDKNGANLDRVDFFHKFGIKEQEDFFKKQYVFNTLKMYYKVKNEYPKYLKDYKEHISEYRKYVWKFIKNNKKVCRMEKAIYSIFALSPKMAEGLYNKYLK